MKKLIRTSLTFGFVAALPAAAFAQQIAADIPTTRSSSAAAVAPAVDPALEAQIAAAQQAFERGEYRESLRGYTEVAKIQEENGLNAGETYWKIAEIQNALGSPLRTAQALDAAAREADRFGNMDLHVKALYEAAVSYAAGNQTGRSAQRIRRVEGLLDAPGVSEEVRLQIRARMGA